MKNKNGNRVQILKSLGTDYTPGTESFAEGFMGPKGNVGYTMYFSMSKAKKMAKTLTHVREITAGLDGDFGENSEVIYEKGEWNKLSYMYDHSIWATPIIIVKFYDKPKGVKIPSEAYECWSKN